MTIPNAQSLHRDLLVALTELANAEERAVMLFAEIYSRRLYRERGYSNMLHYARDALGFSREKAYQFLALAEASRDKTRSCKRGASVDESARGREACHSQNGRTVYQIGEGLQQPRA